MRDASSLNVYRHHSVVPISPSDDQNCPGQSLEDCHGCRDQPMRLVRSLIPKHHPRIANPGANDLRRQVPLSLWGPGSRTLLVSSHRIRMPSSTGRLAPIIQRTRPPRIAPIRLRFSCRKRRQHLDLKKNPAVSDDSLRLGRRSTDTRSDHNPKTCCRIRIPGTPECGAAPAESPDRIQHLRIGTRSSQHLPSEKRKKDPRQNAKGPYLEP